MTILAAIGYTGLFMILMIGIIVPLCNKVTRSKDPNPEHYIKYDPAPAK